MKALIRGRNDDSESRSSPRYLPSGHVEIRTASYGVGGRVSMLCIVGADHICVSSKGHEKVADCVGSIVSLPVFLPHGV